MLAVPARASGKVASTMTDIREQRESIRRLFNLRQREQPQAANWFRISPNAFRNDAGGSVAQIYIYGRIGGNFWGEGTTAEGFIEQLQEIGDQEIELHINSPGGDAFDGIAIKNALRQHPARVNAVVDGLAASAASIVAMGADDIRMDESSQMMIHNAGGIVMGNKKDMREFADLLDKMDANIAEIYMNRAGGKLADWTEAMDAESWYTAQEAVDAKLADGKLDRNAKKPKKDSASTEDPENAWDLSMYNYQGRSHAPQPKIFNTAKESGVTAPNNTQTGTQPPTPAAPPALPQPPAQQAVAPVVSVTLDGKTSSDVAEIQAFVDKINNENKVLATFKKETLEAGRKDFVNSLAKGPSPKIAATQIDDLTELALGLTDEQYDKFKASYDKAGAAPLFANHGVQNNGQPSDPANQAQSQKEKDLETARAIVENHKRGGMKDEQLKNTQSYKNMIALEAELKKN